MLSFEPELTAARDAGIISPETFDRLVRIERGEVFSLHHELRLVVYAAIAVIVAGVGILIKNNLDRIGPAAIIFGLLAASAVLYGWCAWKKRRRGELSIFEHYLALLAALLLSSAIGYAESEYHILDDDWSMHFLLLAIIHAATAYYFSSKLLLTVALTSLAAWFGVERRFDITVNAPEEYSRQALICAGAIMLWREAHRRWSAKKELVVVFEHFAMLLTIFAALLLVDEEEWELLGLVVLAFAVGIALYVARKRGSDIFLIYGIVAALIGVSTVVTDSLHEELLVALYLVVAFTASVVLFFVLRNRWEREP